jgi:cytochrome c-type biogenesis protein CcmH/NrfG
MWPPILAVQKAPTQPRRVRGILLIALPLAAVAAMLASAWWHARPTAPVAPAALAPDPTLSTQLQAAERQQLAARLKTPTAEERALRELARSHEAHGRLVQAVLAYEQLARLRPTDTSVLIDLAVAMAMARPRGLRGSPERLLEQVLQLEPGNRQALALLGDAAFDDRDYAHAATRWRELLSQLPARDPMTTDIQDKLSQALALERQQSTQRL